MSVQLAIINKNAVTLASNKKTIINIRLSEIDPVGIMVYGNPYLMGVHWESLISKYRDMYGDTFHNTLKGYSDEFMEFLQDSRELFLEESQEVYFYEKYSAFIKNLKEKSDHDKVKLQNIIEYTYERLKKKEKLNMFDVSNHSDGSGFRKYSQMVYDSIEDVFFEYELGDYYNDMLFNIGRYLFSRPSFDNQSSGVIIAGYGNKDLHPSIISYEIDSVIDNTLIYRQTLSRVCDALNDGNIYQFKFNNIIPLSEEIDFHFIVYIKTYIQRILNSYNTHIINTVPQLSEFESTALNNLKENIIDNLKKDFDSFIEENYVRKMLSSINLMSKGEMVMIAKALLHIIDFKEKNPNEGNLSARSLETVVISRMTGYKKEEW
ncbi:MAG: hypothetical protein AAF518_08170 [Spirochaetota bacterium]